MGGCVKAVGNKLDSSWRQGYVCTPNNIWSRKQAMIERKYGKHTIRYLPEAVCVTILR